MKKKKLTEKQQARQNKIKTIFKWVLCGLGWSILFAGFVSLLVVGVRGCANKSAKSSQATAITTPVKPIQPNNLVIGENEDSSQFEGFNPQSQETTDIVHFLRGEYSQELATGQKYSWILTPKTVGELLNGGMLPPTWALTGAGSTAVKWVEFFNDPSDGVSLGGTIPRPEQINASKRLGVCKVKYQTATYYATYKSEEEKNNRPSDLEILFAIIDHDNLNGLSYVDTEVDNVYALGLGNQNKMYFRNTTGNEYSLNFQYSLPTLTQTGQSSWIHRFTCYTSVIVETKPFTEDSIRYDRYQFSRKYGYYHELLGFISMRPYQGIIVNTYIEGGGKVQTASGQHGFYYSMADYLMESFGRETIYYIDFDNDLSSDVDNPGTTGGNVSSGYESFFSLIAQAFRSIASIMNIQVLPGISVGTLIFIPLVATIVLFVVWLVKR